MGHDGTNESEKILCPLSVNQTDMTIRTSREILTARSKRVCYMMIVYHTLDTCSPIHTPNPVKRDGHIQGWQKGCGRVRLGVGVGVGVGVRLGSKSGLGLGS